MEALAEAGRRWTVAVCAGLALAAWGCAGDADALDAHAHGGQGPGGGGGSGGQSADSATGSGGASVSAASGSSSGSGAGGGGPMGTYAAGDMPAFQTAAELCAYVNSERVSYASHDRYRGLPWSGEYHQQITWPLELTMDATLSAEATATAQALANGTSPAGSPFSDGSPALHAYLYVSGVSSAAYSVATLETAGEWTPDLVGNITAGITSSNGTARMALFYQDAGGSGPVLARVGCGGAATSTGQRWWVVTMAP